MASEFYTWDIPESFKFTKNKDKKAQIHSQFDGLDTEIQSNTKIPKLKCLNFKQLMFKVVFCKRFQP